jgi:ferredoxin
MKSFTDTVRDRKNQTNYVWLHDKTESITIINAILLSETTDDKMCLVFISGTIWTFLGLEDPLTPNNVNTRWTGNKHPSRWLRRASHETLLSQRTHVESGHSAPCHRCGACLAVCVSPFLSPWIWRQRCLTTVQFSAANMAWMAP